MTASGFGRGPQWSSSVFDMCMESHAPNSRTSSCSVPSHVIWQGRYCPPSPVSYTHLRAHETRRHL
eukprot:6667689-Prorocentrum_lima.AAC.1